MKQCTRCILNETFPNIRFDRDGVCSTCSTWDTKWKDFDYDRAKGQLLEIFSAARAKNRAYDCLIPFSGGRDSSYVAYLCREKYGLTPLLVTFNNLFMSPHAMANIQKAVERLGVDHVMMTYRPHRLKAFYRAMIKDGGEFCSICTTGINYVTLVCQKQYHIPLVISGTSTRVDEQSPFEITSTHPVYVRKVLEKNGFSNEEIGDFLIPRQYDLPAAEKIRLKLLDRDFVRINLPDYLPWHNQVIQKTLEEELGWETPDKDQDHIDCRFAPVKSYLKNKQIPHFIFKQQKFSQLIRDGQMTRNQALAAMDRLLAKEEIPPPELDDFLTFFKLRPQEIENREKRSHLDYISKEDTMIKESLLFRTLALPWKAYKAVRGFR